MGDHLFSQSFGISNDDQEIPVPVFGFAAQLINHIGAQDDIAIVELVIMNRSLER